MLTQPSSFVVWTRCAAALLAALALTSGVARAAVGIEPDRIVDTASLVIDETMAIPAKAIPESLLRRAEGVAIIPNVLKVGLIGGISRGRGVVMVRHADGQWGEPNFVTITGGSVGFQIGAQATDLVLVFCTPQSVQGLLQGKLTIGADASAAAGPVGRSATAATDGELRAEIYSYSRSRGLFAGVSLDGSVLQTDSYLTGAFYSGRTPDSAVKLVNKLNTIAPWPNAVPRAPTPADATAENVGPTTVINAAPLAGDVNSERPLTAPTQPGSAPNGSSGLFGPAAPAPAGARTTIQSSGLNAEGWHATGSPVLSPASRSATSATQTALVGAAERLDVLLDDQWKGFLTLPPEIVTGAPSWESLHATLDKYDRVAANPAYSDLAKRPEFRDIHQLLVKLMAETPQPKPMSLVLPPPPAN